MESRWQVTVIATGSIEVSGNPRMRGNTRDLLFVAGRDLKMNGNPDQVYEGYMLVHEQLEISGEPVLNGAIIAEDSVLLNGGDGLASENLLNGNFNLTCNGDLESLGAESEIQISTVSWYEVLLDDHAAAPY